MSAKFPRGEQNHFQPSVYSPQQDPATAFTIQYAHCKAIHFLNSREITFAGLMSYLVKCFDKQIEGLNGTPNLTRK